jgi:hypothetical protein
MLSISNDPRWLSGNPRAGTIPRAYSGSVGIGGLGWFGFGANGVDFKFQSSRKLSDHAPQIILKDFGFFNFSTASTRKMPHRFAGVAVFFAAVPFFKPTRNANRAPWMAPEDTARFSLCCGR